MCYYTTIMFYGLIFACALDAQCIVYKDENDVFTSRQQCDAAISKTFEAVEPLIKTDFPGQEVYVLKICGTKAQIVKEFPQLEPDLPDDA